jgi:hypothetical protein
LERWIAEFLAARVALHAFAHQPPREAIDIGGGGSLTRGGVFVDQPSDLMLC